MELHKSNLIKALKITNNKRQNEKHVSSHEKLN
jgi:hypothetical protein